MESILCDKRVNRQQKEQSKARTREDGNATVGEAEPGDPAGGRPASQKRRAANPARGTYTHKHSHIHMHVHKYIYVYMYIHIYTHT